MTTVITLTGDEAGLLKSIDNVITKEKKHEDQLSKTAATGKKTGDSLEHDFDAVATSNDKAFAGILRDLRRAGPEGRKTAAELQKHFAATGTAGYSSVSSIIDRLGDLDPAAQAAAQAITEELAAADAKTDFDKSEAELKKLGTAADDAAVSGTKSFADFGTKAVASIGGVLGAYVGVDKAIQAVTGYLKDQEAVLDNALAKQIELGKAQQEASKNLAGYTAFQRDELLQESVPEIARQTGFANLTELTNALGVVASGGASYEQNANAVKQSARVQLNAPEKLTNTSLGAVAVQNAAGLDDIRKAISLFTTAGTEAFITDPAALIDSIPKAVGSTLSTVPNQDREEAAKEGAALFSTITQSAKDAEGKSSLTFLTAFSGKLGKFFDGFEDQLIDARSKIQKFDTKIAKGSDTEADRRDRQRLVDFVQVGERIQKESTGTSAFETLSGRIKTVADNPALEQQFVGEGFGEVGFQPFLKEIFDSESDRTKDFQNAIGQIKIGVEDFEKLAEQIAGGTPQLVLSNLTNKIEAGKSAAEFQNIEGASLASVRKIVADTLAETRSSGVLSGTANYLSESFIGSGALEGSTAAQEGVSGIFELLDRVNQLSADGITNQEQIQVDRLNQAADAIRDSLTQNADRLEPDSIRIAGLQAGTIAELAAGNGVGNMESYFRDLQTEFAKVAAAIDKQTALATRTADATEFTATATDTTAKNTIPKPADPNAAQRAIIATNNARSVAP